MQLYKTDFSFLMDPCCGRELQQGTKVVAIIGIVVSLIAIAFYSVGVSVRSEFLSSTITEGHEGDPGLFILYSIDEIRSGLLSFILDVILLIGAVKKDSARCKIWFIGTIILTVASLTVLVVEITNNQALTVISNILTVSITLYELWVVGAFIKELKSTGNVAGNVPVRTQPVFQQPQYQYPNSQYQPQYQYPYGQHQPQYQNANQQFAYPFQNPNLQNPPQPQQQNWNTQPENNIQTFNTKAEA